MSNTNKDRSLRAIINDAPEFFDIPDDLYDYMNFRADMEEVEHSLTKKDYREMWGSVLLESFTHHEVIFSAFGVKINGKGMIKDTENPEAFLEYMNGKLDMKLKEDAE